MSIVGLTNTDILLDSNGQPIVSSSGDFEIVSNQECWIQDIRMEIGTDEAELFYEDEKGIEAYGFSITDFLQKNYDDFTETEIRQRIAQKLKKRTDIDERTINIDIQVENYNYKIRMTFKLNNSENEYNIDIETNGVEVIISD